MALLKKGQMGKTLITAITAVAVLAVAVPLVSAYEAHVINVKAHVKERFNVIKTMRLATQTEIDEYLAAHPEFSFPNEPNPGTVEYPDEVPIETCVVWVVTITICNPHDYPMTEVVVKDYFGAELAGEPLDDVPVDLDFKYHTRGKGKKEKDPFTTQYRITWYVTYVDGNVEDPEDPLDPLDNSGVMEPGECAHVELLVWTKLNPSGKQEYTSPGLYTLNSGPTAKWFDAPPDEGGHQFSFDGDPLYIYAY